MLRVIFAERLMGCRLNEFGNLKRSRPAVTKAIVVTAMGKVRAARKNLEER
jgi:hypothetical protein